jgi:hypothetical protein
MNAHKTRNLMVNKEIAVLEKEKFYQSCLVKWLKGYSVDQIAKSENEEPANVLQAINIKRKSLRESQEADIADLVAERIGGLRQLQQEAHEYLEFLPDKAPQLLTVAMRAEENIAKIQGVLSDKVLHLGRIQHEVKLYDFSDKTPPPLVVDAPSYIVLEEPELPQLETVEVVEGGHVQVVEIRPSPTTTILESILPKLVIETSVGGYMDG